MGNENEGTVKESLAAGAKAHGKATRDGEASEGNTDNIELMAKVIVGSANIRDTWSTDKALKLFRPNMARKAETITTKNGCGQKEMTLRVPLIHNHVPSQVAFFELGTKLRRSSIKRKKLGKRSRVKRSHLSFKKTQDRILIRKPIFLNRKGKLEEAQVSVKRSIIIGKFPQEDESCLKEKGEGQALAAQQKSLGKLAGRLQPEQTKH